MEHEVKEEENKVVLKVDMHCEGCKGRVRKALKDIVGKNDIMSFKESDMRLSI